MDELYRQARRKARRVGQSQPRSAGPVDKRPISDQDDRPKKRRLSLSSLYLCSFTFRVIENALAFLVMLYVCCSLARRILSCGERYSVHSEGDIGERKKMQSLPVDRVHRATSHAK